MTGTASTPDAPDLTIIDPVRIVLHCRPFDDVGIVEHFPLAQWENSGTPVWFFGLRLAGLVLGKYDSAGVRGDVTTMNGAEQGAALHKNQDGWIGLEVERTAVSGVSSIDGVSWTAVRKTVVAAYTMRDGTSKLTIGTHGSKNFNGRIYLAKMEAIKRAKLVFPGYAGNWATIPAAGAIGIPTGDCEIVARVSSPVWANAGTPQGIAIAKNGSYYFLVGSYISFWTNGVFPGSTAHGFTNGSIGWVRATRIASTGAIAFYSAPDSPTEPTSWTARGTATSTAGPMTVGGTTISLGAYNAVANPFNGRILRIIVRDGIGGTALTDVSENNAGVMLTPTTFDANVGGTVTVNTKQPLAFVFPGIVGNWLKIPNAQVAALPADVEFVFRCSMPNWYETSGVGHGIVGKFITGSRMFLIRRVSGNMQLVYTPAGGATLTTSYAVPLGFSPNQLIWFRIRHDADNGASGHTQTFEYSAADTPTNVEPTTWTSMGAATIRTPAAALSSNTYDYFIGSDDPSRSALCRIDRVIIRNGFAGTVVLDVNSTNPSAAGVSSFTATTGGVVTVVDTGIKTHLAPLYGTVTTPDPVTLPGQVTFVARVRGPSGGTGDVSIAGQWATSGQYSWLIQRRVIGGAPITWLSTNGTASAQIISTGPAISPNDEWLAFAWDFDNGVQRSVQILTSTDGITWTPYGSPITGARYQPLDSTSDMRIGGHGAGVGSSFFDGNIYSVEARTGLDPTAGTLLWRFDAAEYPGTGTVFTDPRGRVWTLTAAAAIAQGHTHVVQNDPLVPTVNIVQPQPDSTIWEFNPNDYPRYGTVYTDPRGRVWTLTSANAIPQPPVVP